MSRVFFISDLHLGHKKILEFEGHNRQGDTVVEHNHILVAKWNSIVKKKKDKVFVLGDVVLGGIDLDILGELNGRKILVRGNHDTRSAEEYLKYFEDIHGVLKYKKHWLSHAPIHPNELRGCKNIHGHVHSSSIRNAYHEIDHRYVNVCVENCDGYPVPFDDIKSEIYRSK